MRTYICESEGCPQQGQPNQFDEAAQVVCGSCGAVKRESQPKKRRPAPKR